LSLSDIEISFDCEYCYTLTHFFHGGLC
jgi:hypothetical protein